MHELAIDAREFTFEKEEKHTNRALHKSRIIAFALLVCFLVASILSNVFILTQAGHTHDHSGANGSCTTCSQVQNTGNTLKQLCTAFVGAFYATAGLFALALALRAPAAYADIFTPVALKIRMNN